MVTWAKIIFRRVAHVGGLEHESEARIPTSTSADFVVGSASGIDFSGDADRTGFDVRDSGVVTRRSNQDAQVPGRVCLILD